MSIHFRQAIQDTAGNLLTNGVVTVCQPGTTTPIQQQIYSDAACTIVLANPFTASLGYADFYVPFPMLVRLQVAVPTFPTYYVENISLGIPDGPGEIAYAENISGQAQLANGLAVTGTFIIVPPTIRPVYIAYGCQWDLTVAETGSGWARLQLVENTGGTYGSVLDYAEVHWNANAPASIDSGTQMAMFRLGPVASTRAFVLVPTVGADPSGVQPSVSVLNGSSANSRQGRTWIGAYAQ